MRVEHSQAYRFIMQDDVYLLPQDKPAVAVATPQEPAEAPTPELAQPPVAAAPASVTPPVTEPQPVAPAVAQPTQQTSKAGFNYLGGNQKQFLILVNYTTDEHIAANHLTALQAILGRKALGMDDVAILNVNKLTPIKLTALTAFFNPTQLVIMGKDALPEGIGNLPLNKPVQGKKTHVLYSFSFDEMMSSNDNKKAFWEQMKML